MRPIVDGLEAQYGEQVDFLYLDAGDGSTGEEAFDYYALRGHPALLIITPDGAISWQNVGVISRETVERQIQIALADSG